MEFEQFDFTDDIEAFKSFLAGVKTDGGGDAAENVLGGLSRCRSLSWSVSSVKAILHICDAPPHGVRYHGGHVYDEYEDDTRWDLDVIFSTLHDLSNISYFIYRLNDSVKMMCDVFIDKGKELNLRVEEKEMGDVKDLLRVTLSVLKHCIGLRMVKMSDLEVREAVVASDCLFIEEEEEKSKFHACVGIDFGTDGTAYSYCQLKGDEKVFYSQSWDGKSKAAGYKTRTDVLLKQVDDGDYEVVMFGNDAERMYIAADGKSTEGLLFFSRFKMNLYDDTGDSTFEIKDKLTATKSTTADGKVMIDSEIVITKSLEYIKGIVLKELEKNIAVSNPDLVQWVVTVPAIWSDKAKGVMRNCAVKAGLCSADDTDRQLEIAFEPDCGSLSARNCAEPALKEGDSYLLLDLGGGTADISAHRILDEHSLEQIHYPTGGPYGSSYVDDAFFTMLSKIIGDENWAKWRSKYGKEFVKFKRDFRASKEEYKGGAILPEIEMPSDLFDFCEDELKEEFDAMVSESEFGDHMEVDEGYLSINDAIWRRLFDECVKPLIAHVKKLLELDHLKVCFFCP